MGDGVHQQKPETSSQTQKEEGNSRRSDAADNRQSPRETVTSVRRALFRNYNGISHGKSFQIYAAIMRVR
jgi:hypothetical protein